MHEASLFLNPKQHIGKIYSKDMYSLEEVTVLWNNNIVLLWGIKCYWVYLGRIWIPISSNVREIRPWLHNSHGGWNKSLFSLPQKELSNRLYMLLKGEMCIKIYTYIKFVIQKPLYYFGNKRSLASWRNTTNFSSKNQ